MGVCLAIGLVLQKEGVVLKWETWYTDVPSKYVKKVETVKEYTVRSLLDYNGETPK